LYYNVVVKKVKNSYCVAELEERVIFERLDQALRARKRLDWASDNVQADK